MPPTPSGWVETRRKPSTAISGLSQAAMDTVSGTRWQPDGEVRRTAAPESLGHLGPKKSVSMKESLAASGQDPPRPGDLCPTWGRCNCILTRIGKGFVAQQVCGALKDEGKSGNGQLDLGIRRQTGKNNGLCLANRKCTPPLGKIHCSL